MCPVCQLSLLCSVLCPAVRKYAMQALTSMLQFQPIGASLKLELYNRRFQALHASLTVSASYRYSVTEVVCEQSKLDPSLVAAEAKQEKKGESKKGGKSKAAKPKKAAKGRARGKGKGKQVEEEDEDEDEEEYESGDEAEVEEKKAEPAKVQCFVSTRN